MKRRGFVIGAGAAAAAGVLGPASDLMAGDGGPAEPSFVNVRDHGAAGNGQADDTDAVRRAVAAAGEGQMGARIPHASYYASIPEVFFPPGVYRLSDTIRLGHYSRIRGTGNARIELEDTEKDLFLFDSAYRNHVEGVCLVGGGASSASSPTTSTPPALSSATASCSDRAVSPSTRRRAARRS